jgi:hypothetical protein
MIVILKLYNLFLILFHYISTIPERFIRILFFPFQKDIWNKKVYLRYVEWIFLLSDLLGLPEIISFVHELVNWNLRSLSKEEKQIVESIFGGSIIKDYIRINPKGRFFCKKWNIAFVSFNTINFYGQLSLQTFVHELVHIWQFEKFGSLYIIKCLQAQRSKEGYNYGGKPMLLKQMNEDKSLMNFNFEQAAEIVKDGFVEQTKSEANPSNVELYKHFMKRVKE